MFDGRLLGTDKTGLVKYAARHLHYQRQTMSAPPSDNSKQICENILIEGRCYNIEHRITA